MNKLVIPSILAATVLVAGMLAFMPIEKAQTVHTGIQTTVNSNRVVAVTQSLGGVNGAVVVLDVTTAANGIASAHIAAVLPVSDTNNTDNCATEVEGVVAGTQILAGQAGVSLDNIIAGGIVTNAGINSLIDVSGDIDLCVFHGTATLAGLQALADPDPTIFTDIAPVIPADIDPVTMGNQAAPNTVSIHVTARLNA